MNAVAPAPTMQGVICRNCGKPIRLSRAVVERQSNLNPDLVTKVFSARCRKCHRESVYAVSEIEDISHPNRG
jgi:hypothetical protein